MSSNPWAAIRGYAPRRFVPLLYRLRDVAWYGRALAHRSRVGGDELACNYCGFRSKSFLSHGHRESVLVDLNVVGGGYRENSICPKCGSTDRERLVKIGVEQFVTLPRSPVILHLAPERQLNRFMRSLQNSNVVEGDIDPGGYPWTTSVREEDVTRLSFADATFDLVVCNHVLEHVPDDTRAMRELHRVIKPGGFAVLQVPYSERIAETDEDPGVADPQERLRRFGQMDHVRLYSRSDFIRRNERAGFVSRFISAEDLRQFSDRSIAPTEGLLIFQRPVATGR